MLKSKYDENYPAYVYDDNSIVYDYVENYETYLKNMKVNSAEGTLISYEQLLSLDCDSYETCTTSDYDWIYYTSYWTGTATDKEYLWRVTSDGTFGVAYYSYVGIRGIRPVINISVSEIEKLMN